MRILRRLTIHGKIVDQLRLQSRISILIIPHNIGKCLTQAVRQYVSGTVSWFRMYVVQLRNCIVILCVPLAGFRVNSAPDCTRDKVSQFVDTHQQRHLPTFWLS